MAGCIASAAGAVVLLITGQHPDVGRMQPDELALAASAATALLAMKLPRTVRGPVVAGGDSGGSGDLVLCGGFGVLPASTSWQ